MKIEVVEFYPLDYASKYDKIGTLHIFVAFSDKYNMDLRGINVFYKKEKLFFFTPSVTVMNHRTKKTEMFPLIEFMNVDSKKSFINEIRRLGAQYIQANFKLPLPTKKELQAKKELEKKIHKLIQSE